MSRAPRGPVAKYGRIMAGEEVLWRSRTAVDAAGTSLRCRGRRRGRAAVTQPKSRPVLPVGYIANPRGPVAKYGRIMAGGEVLWRSHAEVDAAGMSLRCRGRQRAGRGNV